MQTLQPPGWLLVGGAIIRDSTGEMPVAQQLGEFGDRIVLKPLATLEPSDQ